MRTTINGKKYTTRSAMCIGKYSKRYGWRDFRNITEKLYVNTLGEFFLAGYGGPWTHYAVYSGSEKHPGTGIIPLSIEDACDWCKEHLKEGTYECYFEYNRG